MEKPIIPYLGNKKEHVPFIIDHLPSQWCKGSAQYIEPFVGSGIVFQCVRPGKAILNDRSQYVMGIFAALKNECPTFMAHLKALYRENSAETYLRCKSTILTLKNGDPLSAAMYAYLQRTSLYSFTCPRADLTAFRGSYRASSSGRPLDPLLNVWQDMAGQLKRSDAKLMNGDFVAPMREARRGDFMFLDPPYEFTGTKVYNKFTKSDSMRLAEEIVRANREGCFIMLFNHAGSDIFDSLGFHKSLVSVQRRSNAFRNYKEVMYTNYSDGL